MTAHLTMLAPSQQPTPANVPHSIAAALDLEADRLRATTVNRELIEATTTANNLQAALKQLMERLVRLRAYAGQELTPSARTMVHNANLANEDARRALEAAAEALEYARFLNAIDHRHTA